MKKSNFIVSFIFIIVGMSSCSTVEDIVLPEEPKPEEKPELLGPKIAEIFSSGCLGTPDPDLIEAYGQDNDGGTFEMIIDEGSAKCKFSSLVYSCGQKAGVKVSYISYKDGVMTIVEYPLSEWEADCLCEIDVSFTIEDLPKEDFMLKIYRGKNVTGEYDELRPRYSSRVVIADGGIKIPY